jgi:hypothetical protein
MLRKQENVRRPTLPVGTFKLRPSAAGSIISKTCPRNHHSFVVLLTSLTRHTIITD